ncbi:MAG: glycosyltransferase family 4 protein [Bacteroidetes bacterium]|nr:glycosyltransferase family 4 protein [Bacteroidota bacterium]
MKIAINTRLLIKNKLEGIGWFTYETLKRITQQHKEHQFYFIFDRKHDPSFIFSDNITPIEIFPQARHPFLYYLWFEYSIPHALNKINPDLFFSPDGYLSLNTRFRSMNVFHDLNFEHYPKDLPYFERKYYQFFFPRYARKASRIATVSEYSKTDIEKQYGISADKIDVVYNGANENFRPIEEQEKDTVRQQYAGGFSYFVFVGALHPRKNLVNLFKAYDQFKQKDQQGIKLMIVGEKMWWTSRIREAYEQMNHKEDIIFSGRLGLEELIKVVGSALALTYVSYFEGFGIPIVESFYAETPVITSSVTSMPEVAGDAALLVDPFSVESIRDALIKIAGDETLRKKLVEKGRKQRQKFSWQQSADRLWQSMEKALDLS